MYRVGTINGNDSKLHKRQPYKDSSFVPSRSNVLYVEMTQNYIRGNFIKSSSDVPSSSNVPLVEMTQN